MAWTTGPPEHKTPLIWRITKSFLKLVLILLVAVIGIQYLHHPKTMGVSAGTTAMTRPSGIAFPDPLTPRGNTSTGATTAAVAETTTNPTALTPAQQALTNWGPGRPPADYQLRKVDEQWRYVPPLSPVPLTVTPAAEQAIISFIPDNNAIRTAGSTLTPMTENPSLDALAMQRLKAALAGDTLPSIQSAVPTGVAWVYEAGPGAGPGMYHWPTVQEYFSAPGHTQFDSALLHPGTVQVGVAVLAAPDGSYSASDIIFAGP